MSFSELCNHIFNKAIADYHIKDDIEAGRKYMKVYRQMKMYNDPSTNPVLYKK